YSTCCINPNQTPCKSQLENLSHTKLSSRALAHPPHIEPPWTTRPFILLTNSNFWDLRRFQTGTMVTFSRWTMAPKNPLVAGNMSVFPCLPRPLHICSLRVTG